MGALMDEACGYAAELSEVIASVKSLASQYDELMKDVNSILTAEGELLSCLRLHANDYFGNLSIPTRPERVELDLQSVNIRDMGCQEALRALVSLRSKESSLAFMLSELRSFVINEIVRLAGLIGLCRHFEPALADKLYSEVLDAMVRKYLGL
ncbi:MAG: hypothetical protein ACP5FT_00680 [Acidilobus sp.]